MHYTDALPMTMLGGAIYTPNCFDACNFQFLGVKLFDLQICWPDLAFCNHNFFYTKLHAVQFLLCMLHIRLYLTGG